MLRRLLLSLALISTFVLNAQTMRRAPAENLIGPTVMYDYQNGNHFLGGGLVHFHVIRRYDILPTLVSASHAAIGFRIGGPRPMIAPNVGMGLHWWLLCADVKAFYFTDYTDKTMAVSINGGMTFWGFCYGTAGYTFPLAGVDPLDVGGFHVTAAINIPFYRVKW